MLCCILSVCYLMTSASPIEATTTKSRGLKFNVNGIHLYDDLSKVSGDKKLTLRKRYGPQCFEWTSDDQTITANALSGNIVSEVTGTELRYGDRVIGSSGDSPAIICERLKPLTDRCRYFTTVSVVAMCRSFGSEEPWNGGFAMYGRFKERGACKFTLQIGEPRPEIQW